MIDDAAFEDASQRLQDAGLWPPVSGVYLPDDAREIVVTGKDGFTPEAVAQIHRVLHDLPHKIVERPVEPGIYF